MISAPNSFPTAEHIVELDRIGDQIAELSAHLEAATARLLDLIREFDARGGWNTGFRSCADWLSWRVGLELGAARERVRVARALATLPRLAQALARGKLSYSKVRALTRVAAPDTEERLLAVGMAGTAHHVERIVRGWRRVDRLAEGREAARRHASRALRVYHDEDGMVAIRGRLPPEVGAVVIQALTAARETLYQRTRAEQTEGVAVQTPMEQQQADALALVAETPCTTESIPALPESATRSLSTSKPRYSRMPMRRVSLCSRMACTFPRERPSALRAMRAAWSCATPRMAGSKKSARGPGPFPPRYGGRSIIAIAAVGSRAAGCHLARAITSATGRTAVPRRSRISHCSVVVTTARSTKRATTLSVKPMESYAFAGRTAGRCPTSRLRLRCRPIPSAPYEPATMDTGFSCTRAQRCRAGSESGWTLATRSTSFTHWPPPAAASSTHRRPPRADCSTTARAADA